MYFNVNDDTNPIFSSYNVRSVKVNENKNDTLAETMLKEISQEEEKAKEKTDINRTAIENIPQYPDWLNEEYEEINKTPEWFKQLNVCSPDEIEEWKRKGGMGFAEVWEKQHKWQALLPYANTTRDAAEAVSAWVLLERAKNGEELSDKQKDVLVDYLRDLKELEVRGYKFGAGAFNTLLTGIPYAEEFAIGLGTSEGGVGLAALGKTLSTIGAKKAARKAVQAAIKEAAIKSAAPAAAKKTLTLSAAKKIYKDTVLKTTGVKALANVGAKQILKETVKATPKALSSSLRFGLTRMPETFASNAANRQIATGVYVTDMGDVTFRDSEHLALSIMKALGDTTFETLTETAGWAFSPVLKYFAKPLQRVLPKKFFSGFEKLVSSRYGKPAADVLRKYGYDGVLEEMGEELLNRFLCQTFGINGLDEYNFDGFMNNVFYASDPSQWATEALAFTAMSAGGHVLAGSASQVAKEWEKRDNKKELKRQTELANQYIFSPEKFYLDQGLIKIPGSQSLAEQKLRDIWISKNIDAGLQDDILRNMSESEIRSELEKEIREDNLVNEKAVKEKQDEVETTVYNKLLKGGVQKDVAYQNAKLFGQFYKRYGAKHGEAFDKWFKKFDVEYNVPAAERNSLMQNNASFAGAEKNEIAAAQKEWNEKGTDSKYFKKWFGKSKVVDEQGKPLIVYHGTESNFKIFKHLGNSRKIGTNIGFFFTDSVEMAKEYANGKRIMPTYLSLQNPLIIEPNNTIKMFGEEIEITDAFDFFTQLDTRVSEQELKDELIKQGYDGIILKNTNVDTPFMKDIHDVYVAFNDIQIKSVNNRGTFDENNPNIFYQKDSEQSSKPKFIYNMQELLKKYNYSNNVYFKNKTESIPDKDKKQIEKFKDTVDEIVKRISNDKSIDDIDVINLGYTPKKLQEAGLSNKKLKIDASVITKAMNEKNVGHTLNSETIKTIPELLHNPIVVMKSISEGHEEDSVVVITDAVDNNDKNVIVAIRLDVNENENNSKRKEYIINEIMSIHGRSNIEYLFGKTLVTPHGIKKIDKNKMQMLLKLTYRLQNDGVVTPATYSITDNAEDFNPDVKKHEDRNLIMAHASKSANINNVIESGSLIAPSFSITARESETLEEGRFGDVIFIRNPKKINYQTDNIYDRDIYSPRMPQPHYDIPDGRVVDYYEYDSLKRSYENKPEQFVEKWGETFDEMFKGAKKVLFLGYTPSGNRRYVPYTNENILKEMAKHGVVAKEGFDYGLPSLLAKFSKKQTSKENLKEAAKKGLGNSKDLNQKWEDIKKEYDDLGDKVAEYYYDKYSFYEVQSEAFYYIAKNNMSALKKNFDMKDIPADLIKEVKAFVEKASTLPRSYFEAKPMKEVSLSEFNYALVKKDTLNTEQIKALNDYGVKVKEYEKGELNKTLDEIDKNEAKIFFQENDTDEENLFVGFTYPQIMDKLMALNEKLAEEYDNLSQEEIDSYMAKIHVLEDAFEASEHPEKFSNEERYKDIMLNTYYVMNDQEIPDDYVDTDKNSSRSYNDFVKLHNAKKEEKERAYLGYFTEGLNDKNIITIMENHNSSTALHELGHLFLNGLNELAKVDSDAKLQLEAVNKWLGFSGEYTVEQQEKFARSFEAYLYKGKAPNNYLREVFESFKEWLKSVYRDISELVRKGADISDEVQEMFDNIFADDTYYQERKQINELLKKTKKTVRKERIEKINVRDDSKLDERAKRHKEACYEILSAGTGKSVKYLKTIFETSSNKKSFAKKREAIETFLESVEDNVKYHTGMQSNWREFFTDPGISYDTDELDADRKLVEQALDVIINKSYGIEFNAENELEERALYFKNSIDKANKEYKILLSSFKNGNRNVALGAVYEWLSDMPPEIKQDFEDRFIYDAGIIERNEHVDKFDKAKRDIVAKALELNNKYKINENEKYQETVKEIIKSLNFLQPTDKARLTANILDVPSTAFLMSSIDNILDVAKTMEDVQYRRKLEKEIHKELQGTKNVRKNGRSVGKFNYQFNKLFEELRKLDRLTPEQANEQRLENKKFAEAEDSGLSYADKVINKFLSYKAGGRTFADTDLMKDLYDEILKIKLAGKSAKSEQDMMEQLSEEKDIDELIDIIQNKKEAKTVTKMYINGFGNLESIINALFNKDIKERYASDILYDETQAQAWQYEQKKTFEEAVAKIYNVNKNLWDMPIIKRLSEKHTYIEYRRKYDEKGNVVKVRNINRTLSKMDIIQAFIWSKNEVLEKRLLNQFGEEQLDEMFSELSQQDIELAELMIRMAQSYYPLVNKAYIDKYGLDLPKVSCYFPSTPERGSEVDLYNDYSSKSLGNGFTKSRANSEILPMDFHNPVATLYSHIDGVAKFAFMAKNLDAANIRFRNNDLKRAVIDKYGEDAFRSLEQALMNVTYKKEAPVFNGYQKVLDTLVSNWVQANVAIKPIVGLKQLLSANNYALDMPYMTWQIGFLKALAQPKATIDYMMKIPYLRARYGGSYSNEFLKQTIENSAFAGSKKLKDLCSVFIKMGDIGAIIFGGKPYIDYLIKEKGMSESDAIKQFILSTNRSQQSSAISSLSNFQVAASRSPIGRLFVAYKNSPQQYFRMCGDALISAANGDITKAEAARIIFQFGYLQPFLYAAATSGAFFRLFFTGDDDDLWNDLKVSLFNLGSDAMPLLGDMYKYAIQRLVFKEKYVATTTPLLGDVQNEIGKLAKDDIEAKDFFEAIAYMLIHAGAGYNTKAIQTEASGVGDIVTGKADKGLMKVLGYTDKRAKRITEE